MENSRVIALMHDRVDMWRMRGCPMVLRDEANASTHWHVVTAKIDGRGTGFAATLTRHPHVSEGNCVVGMGVMQKDLDEVGLRSSSLQKIDAMALIMLRLHRRDAAIEAAGTSLQEGPAWAYGMHRIAKAILAYEGQDLGAICVPEDHGDLPERAPGSSQTMRSTVQGLLLRRGRVMANSIDSRTGGYLTYHDVTLTPTLGVLDAKLPETVMNGIVGMDLGDVIHHPAWKGHTGVRITGVDDSAGSFLQLHLEDVVDPLDEAPSGIDVEWRRDGLWE